MSRHRKGPHQVWEPHATRLATLWAQGIRTAEDAAAEAGRRGWNAVLIWQWWVYAEALARVQPIHDALRRGGF